MSLLDTASLIVTPNGYKEGKLYSVIPSDGSGDMSVVRATTATRVNSAGLVELVPYNLLTYSEQLSNWTNIQFVTVTDNVETAPNGTLTASRINETAVTNVHRLFLNPTVSANKHTYSVYLKAGTRNWAFLRLDGLLIEQRTWFDIQNGTIGTTSGDHTATIEDAGNGWYRCSVSIAGTTYDTTPLAIIGLATANGVWNYAGDVNEYIYAWGAQLVEGSNALPYQKTETRLNIPRLDYSNGTCPSLLVEPQRTNSCLWSEDFSEANWTKNFGSLSSNVITSPSGTLTADKWVENTTNTEHYLQRAFTSIASTTYSFSLYAKAAERTRIVIQLLSITAPYENVYVDADLSTGTLVVQQGYNGATFAGATIEELPNGWYRISASGSIGTKTNMRMRIYTANDLGQVIYLGDGTSGLYVWGAQLEAGSYPTSYIPTTSSSVTRNADVISKTGISSLIGQTEGTMFVDFVCNGFADYGTPLCINDGSTANSIWITTFGNGDIRGEVFGFSNVQASFTLSGGIVGQRYKLALVYKANDFVMYINGNLIGSDASGSVPLNLSRVDFDYTNSSVFIQSALEINAAALWQTRLTNDQLAQLTTI